MKTPLAALAVLLSVSPLAAQDAPKGKAVGTYTPPSCGEPGAELEKASFDLAIPGGQSMRLIYSGCEETDRNDLIGGYTERYYEGTDGYSVTLVTSHGDGAYGPHRTDVSDVIVGKGETIVAHMGVQDNAALVKNALAADSGYALKTVTPKPSTAKCEANLPKASYGPNELWILTPTKALYYREDCDICAELDSCDLKTGAVKTEITAHMVSCGEAKAKVKGEELLFVDCAR